MTAGETYVAPAWHGPARWRVELLGRPRKGCVLVKWIDGPLAGREARLCTKTLVRAS